MFQTTTLTLYRYIGAWGLLNLLAEVVVIIFTIVLTVRLVVRGVCEGREYLCSVWTLMELLKLVSAFLAIVFYVMRTLMIKEHIEDMKNSKGESHQHVRVSDADMCR